MNDHRINFYPVAFGFGPLATAAYIAQEVRQLAGKTITLVLVVDNASDLEYPAALLQCFDKVERMSARSAADLHLTVMNEKAVRALNDEGNRVFIIDVLSWLWARSYAAASLAERYYYQRIPWLSAYDHSSALPDNAIPVNPIVRPFQNNKHQETFQIDDHTPIISLGGMDTTDPGTRDQYLRLLLSFTKKTGNRCFPILFGNMQSFEHDAYAAMGRDNDRSLLGSYVLRGGGLLCAAGLTTVLECLSSGIPFGLLPPQNYSQARLAHILHGYGIPRLTWESPACRYAESHVIEEMQGVRLINTSIRNAYNSQRFISAEQVESLWSSTRSEDLPSQLANGAYDGASFLAKELIHAL